jgi:copper homeostasis protein
MPNGHRILIEACVDAIDSALEAEAGGAGRIELCGELLQGGVTPSAGLIGAVWERVHIPVFVLIRPRPGDFVYSVDELDVMLRDIEAAHAMNVDGVVYGALTTNGELDIGTLSKLIDVSGDMEITFHRAFDYLRDQQVALEALIELGVDRVLTSGGAPTALEGAAQLATLVNQAAGQIEILAGGSINSNNVHEIVRISGVREVHVRAATTVHSEMAYRRDGLTLQKTPPASQYERSATRAAEMQAIVQAATSERRS